MGRQCSQEPNNMFEKLNITGVCSMAASKVVQSDFASKILEKHGWTEGKIIIKPLQYYIIYRYSIP